MTAKNSELKHNLLREHNHQALHDIVCHLLRDKDKYDTPLKAAMQHALGEEISNKKLLSEVSQKLLTAVVNSNSHGYWDWLEGIAEELAENEIKINQHRITVKLYDILATEQE